MRVSGGKLDIASLGTGRPCRIITGHSEAVLVQEGGGAVRLRLRLDGCGTPTARGVLRISRERGRLGPTFWIQLCLLRPCRMYLVTVREAGEMPMWEFVDVTPATAREPRTALEDMLEKILGRKG